MSEEFPTQSNNHQINPVENPEEKLIEHFPTTEKLHSDILEEKYGPIHAEVLAHDNLMREALLVDEKGISRTYALTFFPEKVEEGEIAEIDQKIRDGGMIGKTFKDNGYEVRKNVVDVFIIDIPDWLRAKFDDSCEHAKARISEFYAKKDGCPPVVYGYVLEVYTPDFRDPEINAADMAQVNPSTEMFDSIGVNKDEIWKSLDAKNANTNIKNKDGFKEAKRKTMDFVHELKVKMENRINSR